MVCEMCHRRGSSNEIHKYAYETTASFLGGFEMPFSMVYTMHEACVNSELLRRVNA